jgi:hypothetical protein
VAVRQKVPEAILQKTGQGSSANGGQLVGLPFHTARTFLKNHLELIAGMDFFTVINGKSLQSVPSYLRTIT